MTVSSSKSLQLSSLLTGPIRLRALTFHLYTARVVASKWTDGYFYPNRDKKNRYGGSYPDYMAAILNRLKDLIEDYPHIPIAKSKVATLINSSLKAHRSDKVLVEYTLS